MLEKRLRKYTWYLEPSQRNFAHTNEVVMKNLAIFSEFFARKAMGA